MSTSATADTPSFGKVVGDADLDDALYDLDDIETEFLLQQTGLKDPEEVKKHIIQIQHEVYAVRAKIKPQQSQIGSTKSPFRRSTLIRALDFLLLLSRVIVPAVSPAMTSLTALRTSQIENNPVSRLQRTSRAGKGVSWCPIS